MSKPVLFAWIAIFSAALMQTGWASNNDTVSPEIPFNINYLTDPLHELDVQTAYRLEPGAWITNPSQVVSLGVTPDAAWYRFDFPANESAPGGYVLDLHYPYLDQVEYYFFRNDQQIEHISTGDFLPFNSRPMDFPTFAFPFTLERGQFSSILIKVITQGSMEIPFSLHSKEDFFKDKQNSLMIYVAIFSILSVMALYNLFVYVSVRQTVYVYYCGYCLGAMGYIATVSGFGFQYLWPGSPFLQKIAPVGFTGITHMLVGLFTIKFLRLRRFPKWFSWIKLLTIASGISSFGALIFDYATAFKISMSLNIMISFSALIAGIYVWNQKDHVARLFVLTWTTQFITVFYSVMAKIGSVPVSAHTEYIVPLSSVVVVVLLSFAMADRINILQKARADAQKAAFKHLNRFKNLFDSAIEGIFSLDLHGQWRSANPSMLKMFGHGSLEQLQADFNDAEADGLQRTSLATVINLTKANEAIKEFNALFLNNNGDTFWSSINARLTKSDEGETIIEGSMVDVTARVAFEDKLNFLARHDPLTNLFNRRAFEDRLLESIKQGQANKITNALLYLDLDQFKVLNDTCGHSAGDNLLIQLSSRLSMQLTANQTLARLGGDEFGVLIQNCTSEDAMQCARNILETIRSFRFRHSERDFTIGVSIGLVCFKDEHISIESLLSRADTACFMAKDLGRNRIHHYEETDEQIRQRQSEMAWVNVITEALRQDAFLLMYQHIAPNNQRQEGHHYEILLRLKSNEGEIHAPGQFISAAERFSLMPEVDTWVIKTFFSWLREHPQHLEDLNTASINLSGHSLGDEQFQDTLEDLFDRYEIPADKICFEITESMAITRLDKTIDFIYKYKQRGCRFALDDFGTGFSSYAYLKELPVDFLKIDGFFIRNMVEDDIDLAMVKSIQQVAKTMNIETVAEFVENDEILSALNEIGIGYSQGYLVHKPQPLKAFAELGETSD